MMKPAVRVEKALPRVLKKAAVPALEIAANLEARNVPSNPPRPRPRSTVSAAAPSMRNTPRTLPSRSTTATVTGSATRCASTTACVMMRCTSTAVSRPAPAARREPRTIPRLQTRARRAAGDMDGRLSSERGPHPQACAISRAPWAHRVGRLRGGAVDDVRPAAARRDLPDRGARAVRVRGVGRCHTTSPSLGPLGRAFRLVLRLFHGDSYFQHVDRYRRTRLGFNGNLLRTWENRVVNLHPLHGTDRLDGHIALQELFGDLKLAHVSPYYDTVNLRT